MKKTTGYVLTSIFNFIAAFCFLLAAVFQKQALPKYGFYVAAICLLISATGFLYTYLKNKTQKGKMRGYLMFDLLVDFLGTIGDIFADIWVNKIVAKFKKK